MITDSISATKLLYLDDTEKYQATAVIIGIETIEEKGIAVILDQTIFYPQGGGQPADQGQIISSSGASFIVKDVRMINGIVHHFGEFSQGKLTVNETVSLSIDIERRQANARLHSAGHLIDAAVQLLALPLVPGKGYHFPDGPYVEYQGEIAADERESVRIKIEQKVNELINSSLITHIATTTKSQLPEICSFVPDYITDDKPIRVITFVPQLGCPCGGTHVKNTQEVNKLSLTKVRVKGGNTRFSYQLI
jgi:Ser-tRNA(Ala) deacylase AlaX